MISNHINTEHKMVKSDEKEARDMHWDNLNINKKINDSEIYDSEEQQEFI